MQPRWGRIGAAGALVCALAIVLAPTAWGQLEGRSTVERTLRASDPGADFKFLTTAPGEAYMVRENGIGTAKSGRAGRRRSLLYFGQLSDFQLADEESPARVEFVDLTANPPSTTIFSAAWRPQEALVPQGVEFAIRNMNRFLTSPLAQGDGSRAQLGLALMTGDLADSQQFNESVWVRTLLEGGTLDPNTGSSDPADYADCPAGTPGTAEAARYTGVQDYDDYVEGNQFYDPDTPAGQYSAWPRYPGLMDRAQVPFQAEGLKVPSYIAFGNHDGLVQGNAAATRAYEDVGIGCVKPLVPANNPNDPLSALDPAFLTGLLSSDPDNVFLVPPDPRRRYVDKAQFKAIYENGGQPDGHGFDYVDGEENAASDEAAGYYAWDATPRMRFIAIETISEAGVAGPSAEGNIDDPQWRWLERELDAAQAAGKLIVLFGHHPIQHMIVPLPDEQAPPCPTQDDHGHGVNPGCDRDPRISAPVHLGTDLQELLLDHKNVIAYVAGHAHENNIVPYAREGGGGFWGIETPSIVDWPPQTRLLEVMDNRDGTLSIFGTILDTEAPVTSPPSNTAAGAFGPATLASIGRTLSFNDPQLGEGTGTGERNDRNVELLLRDPRAAQDGDGDDGDGDGDDGDDDDNNGSGDGDQDGGGDGDEASAADDGGGLPFTGLLLIPMALIGAGLTLGGRWLRRRAGD